MELEISYFLNKRFIQINYRASANFKRLKVNSFNCGSNQLCNHIFLIDDFYLSCAADMAAFCILDGGGGGAVCNHNMETTGERLYLYTDMAAFLDSVLVEPSYIYHQISTILYLPSYIYHLISTIKYLPSYIYHHVSTIIYLASYN